MIELMNKESPPSPQPLPFPINGRRIGKIDYLSQFPLKTPIIAFTDRLIIRTIKSIRQQSHYKLEITYQY
jgi:hypothetical protein